MDKHTKINQNVIEYLLFSLDSFKNSPENKDISPQENPAAKSSFSFQSQDIQAAQYLTEFANEMPGGFFIYHADGDEEIIYANKATLRIFNCDSLEEFQALTGNSFRGMVHPDDLEAVEQSILEQIANSQYDLDYVEYRIIQKGGNIRWINDYGHFIRTKTSGNIFYVFISDATEKKVKEQTEKEELLKMNFQKERQLQCLIEEYDQELEVIHQEHLRHLEMIEGLSIDYESIFYADLDTNRIKAYRVSPRFQKQFPADHREREFIGFDSDYINTWVYPEDREILTGVTTPDFIREKLAKAQSFHMNYRVFRESKVAYIQLRIVNVSNDDHISQIILGYRNIDDEIIQEMKQKQTLAQALHEANLANSAKNLFLSNMSHDIRTPMNAIIGFTDLIKKHIDEKEKVSNYLDMIASSSDQLLQLLNDVLEIARIESGKIQTEEQICSLLDIVQQIQAAALPQAVAKNLTLSLDISGLKHDTVCTDQQKISQILSYLVDNAIHYTNQGGWISITVAELENPQDNYASYRFTVQDNGIGISEDFLEHIFEPFEREKNTTLSGIHGTGLGLTITKEFVNILGGTIDVSSVVGKGSCFTITIPLRIQEHSDAPSDETAPASPDLSKPKRILIVDDNEINLEIENEVLIDAGFLVDTASDGSIAVEKVKQSSPGDYDLILMDIQMPIMNGYRATRAIRELADPLLSNIPIIAVSANTFEEDKRTAMESGMNAHLAKPFDTPLLYKMIHRFLKDTKQ